MPKGLLQEKMQRTMPREPKQDHEWASFESQRKVTSQDMRTYGTSPEKQPYASGSSFSAPRNNRMPAGMNIGNQKQSEQNSQPLSLAGATDESNSVNSEMLKKGFQRQNFSMTDELYTNEHVEEFYGEAKVDGKTGFLERNNYLDRN